MKITSFNPLIITKDAEAVIALFEALGFERRHTKTGINDKDISSVSMRYTGEDGKVFHVTITSSQVPQDMTSIRMNVRDFDEAYEFLKAHGFKNSRGEDYAVESKSSLSCLMIAPSGFSIQLTQHIRNHD